MNLRHRPHSSRQNTAIELAMTGLALVLSVASPRSMAAPNGETPEFQPGSKVHFLPRQAPGDDEARAANPALLLNKTVRTKPLVPAKSLTYFGGPVIPNVAVTQVLWGAGAYNATVNNTVSPNLGTFYQDVLTSTYMDMLAQYPSAAANVGHGTFQGSRTIAPSSAAASAVKIDDVAIQAELTAQIKAGALPAPGVNTYYALFFPKGTAITQGGAGSCITGGFCAYHGTFVLNGVNVVYGVHPDMSAGSGCDIGCGAGTPFSNQTAVASHELAESITDPAVGIATAYAAPLGWYNMTYGEIGDICNAQQGTFTAASGVTYTVQKEWSNKAVACAVK